MFLVYRPLAGHVRIPAPPLYNGAWGPRFMMKRLIHVLRLGTSRILALQVERDAYP